MYEDEANGHCHGPYKPVHQILKLDDSRGATWYRQPPPHTQGHVFCLWLELLRGKITIILSF